MLGTASRGLLASRIAVLVLALASSSYFKYSISRMWVTLGYLGINIDWSTAVVTDVSPINAAKGIRPGDRVDLAAMPFRERIYLYAADVQPVGMQLTVPVVRGSHTRAVTIEVAPMEIGPDITIYRWSRWVVAMLFVATGVMLVWNRPTLMLWG